MVSPVIMPGRFLLSTPSDLDGDVSFEFELSDSFASGDKIKLNVVAILEQDSRDDPPDEDNEFWAPSVFVYSMPATQEKNRGIVSPPED
jgi:hypothetical protein